MALLGESLDYQLENNAIDFLNRCQVLFFAIYYFFNVAHGCMCSITLLLLLLLLLSSFSACGSEIPYYNEIKV